VRQGWDAIAREGFACGGVGAGGWPCANCPDRIRTGFAGWGGGRDVGAGRPELRPARVVFRASWAVMAEGGKSSASVVGACCRPGQEERWTADQWLAERQARTAEWGRIRPPGPST